jgi:LmbE family N-acetylglucosaminyl deacetylase
MAQFAAALFVFAHQDDEVAAASRIVFEVQRGTSVFCVFLTDGGAGKALPETRNRESTAVLTSLGVHANQIAFLGSEIPIRDGTLVEHLDLALEHLERRMNGIELDTIYCLAWEGGHQDHDASQLIAAAFARRRKMLDRLWEMPLYHGSGTVGPFFRVLSPVGERAEWEQRRLSFGEGVELSLLAWHYRSQRSSWIGLFPETFLKLAILRRELRRKVDPARFRERPHERLLMYEWRFRFPYERFARAAAGFVDRHLE